MPNVLSKGTLFPPKLTNEMFSLVKGKSSLAKLANSEPMPFNGKEIFTFNLDKEIDIVAENGAKSNGGGTIGTISMTPIKVEYGMRVSDEFRYASQEVGLQYLRAFADGFSQKLARGFDIMAMHGLNPRTKADSTVIGNNCFDKAVTQTVDYVEPASGPTDANAMVEAATAMIQGNEEEISGMAMAPTFRSALAAQTKADGSAMFPELAWGSAPGTLKGLPVDVNGTVSFNGGNDRAILGDFTNYFRWGYAKEILIEVIEYGNPDNDTEAGDLKGHNQVYLRGEAYIGWGILLPAAFARIAVPVTP